MSQQVKKTAKTECIRVIIRCRPMASKEIREGRECVVQINRDKGEIVVQKV